MLATTLANTEDHQDLLAFVDVSEELKQESWQLLKLPIRPQTILKLPYRLFPRPLPDVTQLCKLPLPDITQLCKLPLPDVMQLCKLSLPGQP